MKDFKSIIQWIVFGLCLVIPIFFYIFTFAEKYGPSLSNDQNVWAQFGDYLSGIYASLAFLAVVYSMYVQRQWKMEEDYEKHFFFMLEQHNKELEKLKDSSVIEKCWYELNFQDKSNYEFFMKYPSLNDYLKNVFNLLSYIDCSSITDKIKYTSTLRNYIDGKTLAVIAIYIYDTLYLKPGREYFDKYKLLIEEYVFFEDIELITRDAIGEDGKYNFPKNEENHPSVRILALFRKKAFGNNEYYKYW